MAYIRIQYPDPRMEFEGALESFLDPKQLDNWKNFRNEYIGFYESVIEYILDNSWYDTDISTLHKYYSGFLYTAEEIQKIREYGQYIWDWHDALHDKAVEHRAKHGNYDYIYLTDERLPEVLAETKELHDLMKANDIKYDFERSLRLSREDPDWYPPPKYDKHGRLI